MRAPLYVLAFMSSFVNGAKRREERGAAITEYVVLIGFIVLAVAILSAAGIWTTLANKIGTLVNSI